MLSRHIKTKALLFVIAPFCIFFTQAMDQPQGGSATPENQTCSLVARCLADIKKNCSVIRKSAQCGMIHYSATLDQGSWITVSKNKQPQTYLVFYTVKKNKQNDCTPVYGENAFIIFNQLELLCHNQLRSD